MKKEVILAIVLTIFSVAVSAGFIAYGVMLLTASDVPVWIQACAIVSAGYGITGLFFLMWAWCYGGTKPTKAAKYPMLALIVSFALASFDIGMVSGLELAGIIVTCTVLMANWLAVRKIALWRENA